jgi:hypothetical protein
VAGALGLEHHGYIVPGVGWGDDVAVAAPQHLAAVVRAALLPGELAAAAAGGRHEVGPATCWGPASSSTHILNPSYLS